MNIKLVNRDEKLLQSRFGNQFGAIHGLRNEIVIRRKIVRYRRRG